MEKPKWLQINYIGWIILVIIGIYVVNIVFGLGINDTAYGQFIGALIGSVIIWEVVKRSSLSKLFSKKK